MWMIFVVLFENQDAKVEEMTVLGRGKGAMRKEDVCAAVRDVGEDY